MSKKYEVGGIPTFSSMGAPSSPKTIIQADNFAVEDGVALFYKKEQNMHVVAGAASHWSYIREVDE